ncbi:hypothetical protein [Solirubrobacter soli]|uniref:hypothetical protein n=1 Tax=Solirubrobacter soli TaxID=363832 RepID=UPI00042792D0|nr:hypothetical protein [Solirubrobacter soli]
MSDTILINFFYAQPVGHAIEALHYANGHHQADPTRRISVALNNATPTELGDLCPFVEHTYAIDHPFLESGTNELTLPRDWDWVLDDPRRYQAFQTDAFPGMRDYYAASDAHLKPTQGRSIAGFGKLSYLPHQPLRLDVQAKELEQRTIAIMLAGSSDASLYPSEDAWRTILDALHEAHPDVRPALIGRTAHDARTRSALDRGAFTDHPSNPLDAYDLPIEHQLQIVKASELFLSPHTGFGLAALATGTPWLTISGGRWFEYYFNHVPFRSILPDPERFPSFTQFSDADATKSMCDERIASDLDRIVTAATELLEGKLTYEQALDDYFTELKTITSDIWSIDGVHLRYV